MFGISSGELFFIALIALIVLGPERLPKATRLAGMWVRRARTQWHTVKDELERELAAEELKRSLQDAQTALRDTEQKIRESGHEARREFEQMRASVQDGPEAAASPAVADPASDAPLEEASRDATRPTQDSGDEPRNP
ncbi:MAG: Sec-independent protein translocase protein TatB [Pseudoxanthomonas sp.]